jgi:hypothetical protein
MAKLTDRLKSLFSRNIIIKRMPGDRLKVFDVNRAQMSNTDSNTSTYRLRWRNGRNFSTVSGYGSGYTSYEVEALRKQMYIDYELMDTDSIISAALDIIADETTSNSADGELLVIKTDNEQIKKILHNLFYDILNIEFNLWSWVRTASKYGDCMLYLTIDEEFGILNATPVHPSLMIREEGIDDNPNLIQFRYEGDGGFYTKNNVFQFSEIAHFRLLGDMNLLPYGVSCLEAARKEYHRLVLAEDAMILHRITRAPERRIFKIDVGNLNPNEIDNHMEQIMSEFKRTPFIDPATGLYNKHFNILNAQEDIFLPVRGGKTGTSIETLPGLTNEGQLDDIEYLKSKMMSALKIPKSYLGYDEASSKANLSNEDIRFAKMIERIQKIIVSELYKLAFIQLEANGYKNEELIDFEISLTSPSLIYERQKIDLLNEKFNLISNVIESRLVSDVWIYENILGFTESQWKQEKLRLPLFFQDILRYKQIEEEGNDPVESKRTFGTPHDIASMQVASKFDATDPGDLQKLYSPDERQHNAGQPFKYKTFETDKDEDFGRDPFGRKELKPKQPKMSSKESILRQLQTSMKKNISKKIITEDTDVEPKILNDENILDI